MVKKLCLFSTFLFFLFGCCDCNDSYRTTTSKLIEGNIDSLVTYKKGDRIILKGDSGNLNTELFLKVSFRQDTFLRPYKRIEEQIEGILCDYDDCWSISIINQAFEKTEITIEGQDKTLGFLVMPGPERKSDSIQYAWIFFGIMDNDSIGKPISKSIWPYNAFKNGSYDTRAEINKVSGQIKLPNFRDSIEVNGNMLKGIGNISFDGEEWFYLNQSLELVRIELSNGDGFSLIE